MSLSINSLIPTFWTFGLSARDLTHYARYTSVVTRLASSGFLPRYGELYFTR